MGLVTNNIYIGDEEITKIILSKLNTIEENQAHLDRLLHKIEAKIDSNIQKILKAIGSPDPETIRVLTEELATSNDALKKATLKNTPNSSK